MTPEERCERIDELLNQPLSDAGSIIAILQELTDIMGRNVYFREMADPEKLKNEIMGKPKSNSRLIIVEEKINLMDR
jgi:hypothetical protein